MNASYVLGGSLRRAGNRLRITAQLVETRSGHTLWASAMTAKWRMFSRSRTTSPAASRRRFRINLSPQEEKKIASKPTENSLAYDYFLRGRSYARRENLEFALQMFEQAVKLDPAFALAHAGIANVCGVYFETHGADPKWIERGEAAYRRALEINPQLAEGLVGRARISYALQKHEEAIQYALQAIERKPDCEGVYNVLGRAYFASGRFQEAGDLVERAIEANGDDYNTYIPYTNALDRLGKNDKARRFREMEVLILERQLETVPEDVRARVLLAADYANLGRKDDAIRHAEMAVALRPSDGNVLYNAACTYGVLGRKSDALTMIRRAKEAGYANTDWPRIDPDLACIHDEPEFKTLFPAPAPHR